MFTDGYAAAVQNVYRDWRTDANPHGNICPNCQRSLDECCAAAPSSKDDVIRIVDEHRSFETAACRTFIDKKEWAIARVIPAPTFLTWHIKEAGKAGGGNLDTLKNLKGMTAPSGVPKAVLRGTTGQPNSVNWWTLPDVVPPAATGEDYAEELALFPDVVEAGRRHGFVEVRLVATDVPEQFYKPSALDGFCRDTPFRPDVTDCWHGWTDASDKDRRRPEIVCRAFGYRALRNGAKVTITALPRRQPVTATMDPQT